MNRMYCRAVKANRELAVYRTHFLRLLPIGLITAGIGKSHRRNMAECMVHVVIKRLEELAAIGSADGRYWCPGVLSAAIDYSKAFTCVDNFQILP
jgi:hypothetical protein